MFSGTSEHQKVQKHIFADFLLNNHAALIWVEVYFVHSELLLRPIRKLVKIGLAGNSSSLLDAAAEKQSLLAHWEHTEVVARNFKLD